MGRVNLNETLIDVVYHSLYPNSPRGVFSYVQKVNFILVKCVSLQTAWKDLEEECECGVVGCVDMIEGKCHLCREVYDDPICKACEEGLLYSDAYLDAQADAAEQDKEDDAGYDDDEGYDGEDGLY